jgi:hypothetical protein
LEKRAGIRNELHVPAPGAGEDSMAGTTHNQTGAHELISIELLFTSQAANRSVIGIVRNTTPNVDGWFHEILGTRNSGEPPEARPAFQSVIVKSVSPSGVSFRQLEATGSEHGHRPGT